MLGVLGYAFLRGRYADGEGHLHRSLLAQGRRILLANLQDQVVDPETLAVYQRFRRAYGWDIWAQAAFAVEDLEMLVTGLERWRSEGGDAFPLIRDVEALGGEFFDRDATEWETRVRALVQPASRARLDQALDPADAARFEGALDESIRAAALALPQLARMVPWLGRQAMVRYKHGFLGFVPELVPLPTNDAGYALVRETAESGGILVLASDTSAIVFTGTDAELDAADNVIELAIELARFITAAVVTRAESVVSDGGVALFGEAADDLDLQRLEEVVVTVLTTP